MTTAGKNAPVLRFRAADLSLAVFVAELMRVVVEERTCPVPFAHPAMAGLVDVPDAGPIPVFDLLGLADVAPPGVVEGAKVALFSTERGPIGLRMQRLDGIDGGYTVVTDRTRMERESVNVARRLRSALTALGDSDDGPFFFFSPDAFLVELDIALAARPEAGKRVPAF